MGPRNTDNKRMFGKYRLMAHLATGGMAEIFLASQSSLAGFEKLIVIKRILPNLARESRFVEMFFDEARIAAMLNHPNVVQIFDLGRVDGKYFIAMEYLPGESLSSLIRKCRSRNTTIPPELAAGIVMKAAEGLHHAHSLTGKDGQSLNIVHRDVSPQNIFVLYDGGVKVVDFGIAVAAFRTSKTRTGTLKGKFAYMSPEQILGEKLDGRSDVFSLGIILWECLVGRKLFGQDSDLKLLQTITQKDVSSPALFNPDVCERLATINLAALVRDRDQRTESAAQLRASLGAYLKQAPVDADTLAIQTFMQENFRERIEAKRKLIEGAQDSGGQLADMLFGGLEQSISDTDYSVPRSPIGSTPVEHDWIIGRSQLTSPGGSRLPSILVVLMLMVATALGVIYFMRPDGKSQPVSALRPVLAKPGLAVRAPPPVPDAGTVTPKLRPSEKPSKPKPVRKQARKARRKSARMKAKPVVVIITPAAQPPGTLRLMTNPWTDIYFQGKKLGQTPLVDVQLPAGTIKLRAVNPERGIDKIIHVEIETGQRVTRRFNFF